MSQSKILETVDRLEPSINKSEITFEHVLKWLNVALQRFDEFSREDLNFLLNEAKNGNFDTRI